MKPQLLKFVFLVGLSLLSYPAYSQVNVEASVDMNEATLEDQITLRVVVSGSRKATEPSLPKLNTFQVLGSGVSSNLQITNGNVSFTKTYQYVLIPQEEGDFTINPISVFLDGKEYLTKAIKIKVIGAHSKFTPLPQGIPKTNRTLNNEPSNSPNTKNPEDLADFWVVGKINKSKAFVNEQLVYKFQLFTSKNITDLNYELPEFDSFRLKELGKEKKYERVLYGKKYVVLEKQYLLTPLKAGDYQIAPIQMRIATPANQKNNRSDPFFNDPFFNLRPRKTIKKNLRSEPFSLEVKELPTPIPNNFTGLVGKFKIESSLSNKNISQDDSITLEIKISGQGNLEDASLPEIEFDYFKSYKDKPTLETTVSELGTSGSKTFKIALVPQKSGELEIKNFDLSYFDIEKEEFINLGSQDFSIKVEPSISSQNINLTQNNNTSNNQTAEKPVITDQLAPIKLVSNLKESRNTKSDGILFLILSGVIFLINLLLFLFKRVKKSFKNKSKKSSKDLGDLQNDLKRILKSKESSNIQLSEILNSFLNFSKSRLKDEHERNLTGSELMKILKENHISEEDLKPFKNWLSEIEACSYGGKKSDKELKEWVRETLNVAKIVRDYVK